MTFRGDVTMRRMVLAAVAALSLGACSGTSNLQGLSMSLMAVTPGQSLPYGQFAEACGTTPERLGTRIAAASGFELYDTAPRSTGLRTHYVTGFNDGCPRQFTAALAMFGDVETHESLRYGANSGAPFSATDRAYEQVRGCGRPGAACGSLGGVARGTTFLTVYRAFASSADWADVLLSGGEVVAVDFDGG